MSSTRQSHKGKTLSRQGVLGQKGINLIEGIVLEMASRWTPSGPNEVGIDGYIELFDPGNGAPLGRTLAVQSKAVSDFLNDSPDTFDYWCDRRDLDYWLQGNAPVILIISRPASDEAYWVSIKDYFSDPEHKNSTKITFLKKTQRFTSDSHRSLLEIGRSPEIGLYLAPVPRGERLHSNLLLLENCPAKIYVASTDLRKPREIWTKLHQTGHETDGAWLLRDKRLIAFHDLSEMPWSTVCDLGTLEDFDTAEWSDSEDIDRRRQFTQLLNQTLRAHLYPSVRYWPDEDCYAYARTIDEGPLKLPYRSLKRKSDISVVSRFKTTTRDGRTLQWLRHLAFRGQFRRLGEQWYLEITPTYRFTRDGHYLARLHEDWLKGIKRLEGNRAVLSVLLFWADYLRPRTDLFEDRDAPLRFGKLLGFEMEVGINDKQWLSHDPKGKFEEIPITEELFLPNLDLEI
ncbi:DUF4365 domain-containing protein [Candidatus Manganitrophus noduliformans]|nr:DUF4365 domain-containing protein [Candidatus Manganitrophus noduliformans]